ncbi:RNA polymerase sigma factor [Pleionea sp. CnH1-48]|uniref:RNA polymerase sigma factor n=1 Tax=Pleionea sp. CnH1-48 TaxID=2954494 RepID=UPI0020976C5D|nr:RNA polymerase sigma factor [Pleionea sp. CnH1-48]MCO7225573.1 RNA polymerase sigma factor [Pleionea sp. CnH1-48]
MNNKEYMSVAQIKAGDHQAFQSLVEAYSQKLYAAAYRILQDQAHAEDCVQEVFVKVYQKIGSFDEKAKLSTWLYSITVNHAIDMQRRLSKQNSRETSTTVNEEDSSNPTPEQIQWNNNIHSLTQNALLQLGDDIRIAFLLRHYEEQTIEDISLILDVNPNTVKNRIFRAVKRLKELLEPKLGSVEVNRYE